MSTDHEFCEEDVHASRGGSRWYVAADAWQNLPPELRDLLATPVVVTALPEDETDEEDDGPDYPPPTEPCAVRRGYGECVPRFLAPSAPTTSIAPTALATRIVARRSRRTRRRT